MARRMKKCDFPVAPDDAVGCDTPTLYTRQPTTRMNWRRASCSWAVLYALASAFSSGSVDLRESRMCRRVLPDQATATDQWLIS